MSQWSRNKTLALLIIILSLLAIYFIISLKIIQPMKLEAENVSTEVAVYEAQLERIENLTPLEDEEEALDIASLKIPSFKSSNDVLMSIQEVASKFQITIESIRSEASSTTENDEESNYSVRDTYLIEVTSPSIDNVNSFLDGLLITDRLLVIDRLNVEQSGTDVTASIALFAYHNIN